MQPSNLTSIHRTMTALALAALAIVTSTPALACSPPPSWRDSGLWVLGGSAWDQETPTVIHDRAHLLLRTEAFDTPPFAALADAIEISVSGPTGEIPGTLRAAPLFAHLIWTPDTPFAHGATYTLVVHIEDDWRGDEGRTRVFRVDAAAADARDGSLTVEAQSEARRLRGACISEIENSCGFFCEEHEDLGSEQRIRLALGLDVAETHWPAGRAMRVAAGVDAVEAEAILERTPYASYQAQTVLDVAAYRTWPRDAVCAAVEVVDAVGEVLLAATRCVAVVPDAELGADIEARVGRMVDPADPRTPAPEPAPPVGASGGGEGCAVQGGRRGGGFKWQGFGWAVFGLLVGWAGRRRR